MKFPHTTLSLIPGRNTLLELGTPYRVVVIDMVHFCRLEKKITFYPADVVLFEGILVFYPQKVRDMFHMKLFVDTDSDVRLSRRGTGTHLPVD